MQVTKILRFEAAHRLLGYNGACSNIHGHSYKIEVTIEGEVLGTGMVIDFKDIKNKIGAWLMESWDHALILEIKDPILEKLDGVDLKVFVMNNRPTAENMAQFLLDRFGFISNVKIWETETSYAEVSRG